MIIMIMAVDMMARIISATVRDMSAIAVYNQSHRNLSFFSNHALVIDNKDYNYTLVVSGQNFQIVHHDDGKNLTYKHGVKVSDHW